MIFSDRWSLKDKLISAVSFCLFIQLLICNRLWLDNERFYPKIPVIPNLSFEFVPSLGFSIFCLMLACLLGFIFGRVHRAAVVLFFVLIFLFVFNDINRLQVWMYELVVILLVLFVSNRNNFATAINTLQIIIICVYLWSGVFKMNIYFAEDNFPWLLEPLGLENWATRNFYWGYFIALTESLIGLGLFFNRSRKVAAILAICLHIFILIVLSPFGHNWNHVVWPWNLLMILLVYWLFYKDESQIFEKILEKSRSFFLLPAIFLLFGVLPVFNFWDAWDEQLSFKMYSGDSPEGIFYYSAQQTDCIPIEVKQRFVHITPHSKEHRIILDDWIFYELKVAPYKNKKRLLQAGQKLCRCIEKPELARFELLEVDRWDKSKDRFTTIPCKELLKNFNDK